MVKILILTNVEDAHSRIVFDCLKKKGASPIRWYPEEYIINQDSKITISKEATVNIKISSQDSIDIENIDVVWNRRFQYPNLSKLVHPDDYDFVNRENRAHMDSLLLLLEEKATWVNPLSSYRISNSKLVQLREAARLKMEIPKTLITNHKKDIIDFIDENNALGIRTIYKTFLPPYWEESKNYYNLYTSVINKEILPNESIMRITPGIYQQNIDKQYEIRVTFFGQEYIAIKIDNSDEQDWRILSGTSQFKINLTILPHEIEKKCIQLMQKLGIIFGCFDFIVTPKDEYVFLEVNEMGQFSWIEEMLPNVKIVDRFCDFLIDSAQSQLNQEKTKFSLHEITTSETYKHLLQNDKIHHAIIETTSASNMK
ncbi:hypothetical protein CC99x_000055 [Candidatus Berkiella cookevillensis]|uniref:MvdD-like pre-ATP grasp domain-containing protein n=1 Tax=Candidatus Berkiella cookevillensis TaxID=437022 RepID=A0A0Q9YEB1_9GAMM|nr:hypothetical protein [Candidatus Berkiella cookevillensis]MCS5707287.1 hypothetical protein [Candidatus Berkiella cookevillensis]